MAPFVQNVTDILSFAIVLLDILAVFLFIVLITPLKKSGWGKSLYNFFGANAIFFSFLIAIASVAASLFYSGVAGFEPCLLCWWQRIFLYPQAIILFIAFVQRDERVRTYCLTLSGIGALISTYHSYLQFGGEALAPCSATGVACEHVYFMEYGYVTIPTMALTAFILIILFLLFRKKNS